MDHNAGAVELTDDMAVCVIHTMLLQVALLMQHVQWLLARTQPKLLSWAL